MELFVAAVLERLPTSSFSVFMSYGGGLDSCIDRRLWVSEAAICLLLST